MGLSPKKPINSMMISTPFPSISAAVIGRRKGDMIKVATDTKIVSQKPHSRFRHSPIAEAARNEA